MEDPRRAAVTKRDRERLDLNCRDNKKIEKFYVTHTDEFMKPV